MKRTTILMILFTMLATSAFSQNGIISGQIKDSISGETLPGANVLIEGTVKSVITDFDGKYILQAVQPGIYNLKVSFISYEPVLLSGIKVEAGKNTIIDIKLSQATTVIKEVQVVAAKRSDTELAVLTIIRKNPLIANGISSKQMAMSQDKDASEVIRRVPGITVLDNRFVVVRGLSQRYNNVWLNNAPTPSSEADSKAFSFDIIPTSMIDNLIVYKSASPELPADFTGGFVSIRTKNTPEKTQYTLNVEGLCNTQASFLTHQAYQGGAFDWLGIDDGTRALPEYFPADLQDVSLSDQVEFSKRLNNNWKTESGVTLPDGKLGFVMSHRIKIGETTLGEITSVNYSNSRNFIRSNNRAFSVYDYMLDRPSMDFDFVDSSYTHNINLGILNNWSWHPGNGTTLEFRNLLSNQSETNTLFRTGTEYYSNTEIRSFEYGFKSRLTYSGQVSGAHILEKSRARIDWVAGYSYAFRNEPDLRRIKQIKNDNITDSGYGKYFIDFPNNPLSSNAGRLFMSTRENLFSGGVNYEKTLLVSGIEPKIKAGLFVEEKRREFAARKLGYIFSDGLRKDATIQYVDVYELLTGQYINSTTGIRLAEETSPSDSYSARNHHLAGYVSLNLPISNRLNLFTGLRAEKNNQQLDSYDRFRQPITVDNDTVNLFPSANLTYNFSDKNLMRIAYGKSVNRPEFREIAPFPFYDFTSNSVFSGNPYLKNSYIHNFDLRYEYYPENSEIISLGLFYKKFSNPIEIKYIETGSGLEYSYQNAQAATNYGIEAEVRKALGREGLLANTVLVFNGSYIHSRIAFSEASVEEDRPLAGQSPYVLNLGIFYSDIRKSNMNFSLMYNVIGERIYIVGQPKTKSWESIPDIYEMPRHLIDLTVSRKISKNIEVRLGIKNLLNEPVVFKQSIDTDVDLSTYDPELSGVVHFSRDQIVRKYYPGSYYSIGIQILL